MTDHDHRAPSTPPGRGFRRTVIQADQSVGVTLAAARQQHDRTLQWYANTLGIPARYLEALESDNPAVLPGLVYEKHFVNRYATALGLDPRPLVGAWENISQAVVVSTTQQFVRRVHWRDLWMGPVIWRRAGAALLVLTLATYLGGRLVGMVRPPTLTVTSPAEGIATVERTVSVSGLTEQESRVTINGQTVAVGRDGTFTVPITLEVGTNTIQVAAAKRYSRPATVERRVFVTTPDDQTARTVSQAGTPNVP